MLSTELRVGNLMSGKHKSTKRVSGHDIAEFKSDWKFFTPLPITKEWVERAGFELYMIDPAEGDCPEIRSYRMWQDEKHRIYYSVSFSMDTVQFSVHRTESDHFVLRDIQYVHELQNLIFSITGRDVLSLSCAE